MSEHLLLAPLLESYFRRRLTKQRNATPATLASYRDALRMLILFAAARLRKKTTSVTTEVPSRLKASDGSLMAPRKSARSAR